MKTIKLTDEQFEILERLLDYEFEQELHFQENGDKNTELLEDYLELYKAIYKNQATNVIQAFVYNDSIEIKEKAINELKKGGLMYENQVN